jgi:sporulation protein YlmC with PRC-barrel domain
MTQSNLFKHSPVKATSIIGTKVVNPQDENLGDIKELMIDPQTGHVAYAVVSFGGFLTLGEKLFAIPFGAFDYNPTKHEYILDVAKEKLKEAPGFPSSHWPTMADEKWNRDVHKYFELSPYWE